MSAAHSWLLASLLAAACVAEAGNIIGRGCCVATYNETVDYFPDKAYAGSSQGFSVRYHNNFKVVTLTRTGEVYVLLQRGTPKPEPSAWESGGGRFIEVPIDRAAVLSTEYLAYFELLGERRSIVVTTKHDHLSEPCLLKMIDTDGIRDGVTDSDRVANNVFSGTDVIFRSSGSRDDELSNNKAVPPAVRVDTGDEVTAAGIMEWIEFVSLFFNRELEASRMVEEMKSRYDCIKSYYSQTRFALQPKVRVLYSGFSYDNSYVTCSFDISRWHDQMINDVGGEVIGAYHGYNSSGPCNMTAFKELADTADVWLYSSNNFQAGRYGSTWSVMGTMRNEIGNMAPYANGRTFDPNGNHFRDFWTSRMVQLDVELADLMTILHPAMNYAHVPVWWLDVSTKVDPGRPPAEQCTCKYGVLQLKASDCPGNPGGAAPQNPEGDYGCDGQLSDSVCSAHPLAAPFCADPEGGDQTSNNEQASSSTRPPVPLASLLLCMALAAAYPRQNLQEGER